MVAVIETTDGFEMNESLLENSTLEDGIGEISQNSSFGAWLVFMEMSLALIGIVLNLTVLISIREKESLLNNTINVVLGNLCFANLVSAVFVKSIAVIYHGYAVARARWHVELAFCTVHTITSRATWAVFPYTLVVLCWHGLAHRAGNILQSNDDPHDISSVAARGYLTGSAAVGFDIPQGDEQTEEKLMAAEDKDEEEEDDEEVGEGLTAKQKSAIGFVWCVSGAYSLMSHQILSKERDVQCSLRSDLGDKFNIISLFVAIGIPLVCGPLFCPLGHFILSVCACLRNSTAPISRSSSQETSSLVLDCSIIFGFSIVFVVFYPTHMYISEVYLADIGSLFAFMAFKYCFGCLHLILLPLLILAIRKDIRKAAVETYVRKTTDPAEITMEQLQAHCGIGVQPGS